MKNKKEPLKEFIIRIIVIILFSLLIIYAVSAFYIVYDFSSDSVTNLASKIVGGLMPMMLFCTALIIITLILCTKYIVDSLSKTKRRKNK